MLGKTITPLTEEHARKTVILISKITITTKPSIPHFAPMRTHNTTRCPKKSKITIVHAMTIHIHSGDFCWQQIVVWAHDAHDIVTEPQVNVQATVLVSLVLCLEIGSSSCKLSKLHLRFNRNIHKWCMNVNDTLPDVSPCKWHLIRNFW